MQLLRSARWLLLAALLAFIPASSYAGVFISVGFAPPVLPVYVQPPCPEPGYIWTPGYWAYGDDGYYWVPGAWVPAPYEEALWTPPYWGWDNSVYVFHPGYWGRHVGYYGGINYGFGYFGVGFVGGEWHEHHFRYNTAVVNVNRTVIHDTYINNTVIHNTTIVNNNHVAYVGGPGGIRHDPTPQERVAMRESHVAPTPVQQRHFEAARLERTNYYKANNGHPQNLAVTRPLQPEHRQGPLGSAVNGGAHGNLNAQPSDMRGNANPGAHGNLNAQPGNVHGSANSAATGRVDARPVPLGRPDSRPTYQQPSHPQVPLSNARPAQPRAVQPPSAQQRAGQQPYHPAPQPQPQYHPAPQAPASQQQYHPQPQPRADIHPAPQPQYRPAPQARPESQSRPAQQPRQESHPAPEPRGREPHR